MLLCIQYVGQLFLSGGIDKPYFLSLQEENAEFPDKTDTDGSFELDMLEEPKEVLDFGKMPDISDPDDEPDTDEEGLKNDKKEGLEFESLHVREEISSDVDAETEVNSKEPEETVVKEEKSASEADTSRDNSLSVSLFVHTDEFQDDLDDDLKEAVVETGQEGNIILKNVCQKWQKFIIFVLLQSHYQEVHVLIKWGATYKLLQKLPLIHHKLPWLTVRFIHTF